MFTVKQTARRLNVSTATVYALISAGKLSCHRVGLGRGVIRISEENITEYLAESRVESDGAATTPAAARKARHLQL
jgi:excisionase family DNA binding protein